MKESQGMFKESVVYVTTQGSQVRINGGQVVIYDVDGDDGELGSFPVEKLDTINVFGGVNFSTPFVATANEHGIVLNYFTQNGKYRGASSRSATQSPKSAARNMRLMSGMSWRSRRR